MLHLSRWPSQVAWNRKTWPHSVRPKETTLAERLRAAGFRTGGVWPFGHPWGLRQGFSWWRGGRGRRMLRYAHQVVNPAREFLENDDGTPWFLWVHFWDPHHPYRSRSKGKHFGRRPIDRYDSEIRAVDAELERLLRYLDARPGRREATAIVVTADHGEEFLDHGGRAHKHRLYEELIHVPMLLAAPGVRPGRTRSAAGLLDVAPTVLDLLGVPVAKGTRLEGRTLVPDLLGEREDPGRPVYSSLSFFPSDGHKKRAVVTGDLKLIFDVKSGVRELYHLPSDAKEKKDLAETRPDDTERLMGLVLPFIEYTGSYDGHRAMTLSQTASGDAK